MMDNPFERRATEYLREEEAFLSVIAPEPLRSYLAPSRDRLYDRLVILRGTPGSGKSTLARLFEFPALVALLRNKKVHVPLAAALAECGATVDGFPARLACRLLLETDYRDIWEFPYEVELRHALLTTLIQARSVLIWARQLRRAGVGEEDYEAVPSESSQAAFDSVGAKTLASLEAKAQAVEREIFSIVGALLPPSAEKIREFTASHTYRPFEAITEFRIKLKWAAPDEVLILQPMVILDDAHILHPTQLAFLQRWLLRRELKLGRWILSRIDVERTEDVLASTQRQNPNAELPGVTRARELTTIDLQSDRKTDRALFRKMARDMAGRYLRLMPQFVNRKIDDLAVLLSDAPEPLSKTDYSDLEAKVESAQRKIGISPARRASLEAEVARYKHQGRELLPDERLAMLRILFFRYAKRIPQDSLFEMQNDPEPSRKLVADSGVFHGARFHLLKQYNKPYYFGMEDLCDASSENAEQFLRLSARLVDAIVARMVRPKAVLSLTTGIQHQLLSERAKEFIESWNFPKYDKVFKLVSYIAEACIRESIAPNAWLDAGASSFGIPQVDFETITKTHPEFAATLKFGLAYNAISLVPEYPCKGKSWCLIQLGGLPTLFFGLTLMRGGFVEGTVSELQEALSS
jgi:hypothetical protein